MSKKIEESLKKQIPITKGMKYSFLKIQANETVLKADLKANRNHKGTAFGGSQFSLCALASYALVLKWLEKNKLKTMNIVIAEGNIRYRKPVDKNFKVSAICPEQEIKKVSTSDGKTRFIFPIICSVFYADNKCSEFKANFIANL